MLMEGRRPERHEEDIFLADVEADPDEAVNLAASPEHEERVRDLSARLDRHAEDAVEVPETCVMR
jgi:hypothetical protein